MNRTLYADGCVARIRVIIITLGVVTALALTAGAIDRPAVSAAPVGCMTHDSVCR